MPNWCTNVLKVEGEQTELENLMKFLNQPYERKYGEAVEKFSNPVFSFWNVIRPSDDELEDYGTGETWYNWNINHWGTKWDIASPDGTMGDVELQADSLEVNYITYFFSTAWSPPIPIIEAIAEKYPNLTFTHTFVEPGMDYWGVNTYIDGAIAEVNEGDSLSHSAYVQMNDEDGCVCAWADDEDYLYPDCPKAEKLQPVS
jgi:hypothetical protein